MDADRKPPVLDSPWVGRLLKHMGRAHVWVYRRTGGRVGGRFRLGAGWRKPVPVVLLDHVGRRSGAPYTTPLLCLEDGRDVVVVASQAGRAHHPQWYRNLMAAPDTTVQLGAEVRAVRARTATPAEREQLWPRLVDLYADFDAYQAWTDREIPVVICSPR